MRVFKFGGASVKDAASVRNAANILGSFKNEKIITVISAMGKTTNALEKLTECYVEGKPESFTMLTEIKKFHEEIAAELFENKKNKIFDEINNIIVEIEWILEEKYTGNFDFTYDQIVANGELLSSKIFSAYLNHCNVNNIWMDARDCIITDNNYREARVDWQRSSENIQKLVPGLFQKNLIVITQGFIGITTENYSTTLGREGSDYSAAVFAFILNADEVIVWKDVPGIMNADPRWFKDAILIKKLSYNEAIELTFYGASVIHPKTIKPLQNKNIPLRVKSFVSPLDEGTVICGTGIMEPDVPSLILKKKQMLVSISSIDFSFITEDKLSLIFGIFSKSGIKINLMQNSAISFSACFDEDKRRIPFLIDSLRIEFKVLFNENLELLTIRHYKADMPEKMTEGRDVILEQKTRNTAQLLLKIV